MLCSHCGVNNPADGRFCYRCGGALAPRPSASPAATPTGDPVLSKVIPYKNVPALIAYYCAVFGLIPCLGAVLGLVALVLGFFGLQKAGQVPEAGGRAHAWVGIVLGLVEVLGHGALFAWVMVQ